MASEERPAAMTETGWCLVNLPELPWHVEALVAWNRLRPELVGLRLEIRAGEQSAVISSEVLRRLPLLKIRNAAMEEMGGDGEAAAEVVETRRGGPQWPKAHYKNVATFYERALKEGKPPLPEIQRVWNVSRAAASKWVKRSRELGFLGYPERPGIAGVSESTSPIGGSRNDKTRSKK